MSELGQKLIATVREIAAEQPDYVYVNPDAYDGSNSCVYFTRDGCPSCILGHALARLGLMHREPVLEDIVELTIANVIKHLDLQFDPKEVKWLARVQTAQDSRMPWGAAVLHADTVA